LQAINVDWLYQVMIESRGQCAAAIFFLTLPGQRDEAHHTLAVGVVFHDPG
jgi:hypothetical protein